MYYMMQKFIILIQNIPFSMPPGAPKVDEKCVSQCYCNLALMLTKATHLPLIYHSFLLGKNTKFA